MFIMINVDHLETAARHKKVMLIMINVVHLETAARQNKMLTMANVVHLDHETAARQKKDNVHND